ncbi:MAG: hypothetical protein LUI05_01300 [Oscillospiraceae bacterium]|nr:hypothetical protein [Oscillospiraceae bacterium]
MSVKFDLTVAGAEILDSVIFMDKSPAYAAFKEEIEKILADFNKTKHFGGNTDIDVKGLVESSEETLLHMQRAYLIWTFNEDYGKMPQNETDYSKFLKLFVKSQEKALVVANGGSKSIDVTEIEGFIKSFVSEVSAKPELFNSLKEFFSGYIYGYFFNYLSEQTVMKNYAEFLVCLGIMSNKISTSEAQKQEILPKMAILLNNDRFKYISGNIPLSVMFNIVYDRFELTGITDEESETIKSALREYIVSNYEFRSDGELISDTLVTNVMTKLNNRYICAADFVSDLHANSFDGMRTFLDSDKNDMGEYTYDKLLSVIDMKCKENYDSFYTSNRDAVIETSFGADCRGYKYPLVFSNDGSFWFSDIYKELIFPAADKAAFVPVNAEDLPIAEFSFTESALNTNIIRFLGGIEAKGYTVRTDKLPLVNEIKQIRKSSVGDLEKRMLILEKLLYIISGNMDSTSYMHLLNDCVFETKLYDDYIRYRMDCLFKNGIKSHDAKKKLLDNINSIS